MFYQILMLPIVLLAVIGLVYMIRLCTLRLFSSEDDAYNLVVVPLGKENRDAEFSLRAVANRFKWGYFNKKDKVVCLDCGMDQEVLRICRSICDTYSFMELKKISDFERTIKIE